MKNLHTRLILSIVISLFAIENLSAQAKLDYSYFPQSTKKLPIVRSEVQAFMIDTVVTGLVQPWSMVFLPDKSMLITEIAGRLRMVKNGKLQPVGGNIPRNLRDIKLHPQYEKNGLIYLTYYIDPSASGGAYSVLMQARLERDSLVDQKILYRAGPFKETGFTWGSKIVFDNAGYLYFSLGHRAVDERNARLTVQDKSTTSGKILRLNADGTVPPDNPFSKTPGALPEIFTLGHRNPQGLIIHPVTGDIWESEHGEMGGSEVNLLKPGGNYGWPEVTFSRNYDGTMITKDTARAGMESPMRHWTPSIAPADFDFVYSDLYPAWKGNLFIGAMVQNKMIRTVFKDGRAIHDENLLENSGRIRDVQVGPDKFLYVMYERNGRIVRLIPE